MKKLADNILCWCGNPEEGAVQQAVNISKHPWLVGNVCLMPDTHEGYGMLIFIIKKRLNYVPTGNSLI